MDNGHATFLRLFGVPTATIRSFPHWFKLLGSFRKLTIINQGPYIMDHQKSVKVSEPGGSNRHVSKRVGDLDLESSKVSHEDKFYISELLDELLTSSTFEENRVLHEFLKDVANNNLCLDRIEDQKVIRKFFRTKSHKLIIDICKNYDGLLAAYKSMTTKVSKWNGYRNQVNIDLEYHEKNIEQCKILKEDVLGVYDPNFKALCQAIQTCKFICQPKGPIGNCFSVLGDWKPIVEYILRPFLYTFLVDNEKDSKVLQGLIDKIYGELVPNWPSDYSRRPCVWITKFDIPKYQVENCSQADLTLLTLMDVLRIHNGDKVVTKFLLDYSRMHRILLFRTQHEAFPILSEMKNLPKGCLMAYTLDFFKVQPHPCFRSVQLEMGDSTLEIPEYLVSYTQITRTELTKYRSSRDDLERLLRSLKDLQLELLVKILARKERILILRKGLDLLRKIPWVQVEAGLETLIASTQKSEVVSIQIRQ